MTATENIERETLEDIAKMIISDFERFQTLSPVEIYKLWQNQSKLTITDADFCFTALEHIAMLKNKENVETLREHIA